MSDLPTPVESETTTDLLTDPSAHESYDADLTARRGFGIVHLD